MANDPIFQLVRVANGNTVELKVEEVARILGAVEKQARLYEGETDPLGKIMAATYADLLKKLQNI